jgi:hypothetical protein
MRIMSKLQVQELDRTVVKRLDPTASGQNLNGIYAAAGGPGFFQCWSGPQVTNP